MSPALRAAAAPRRRRGPRPEPEALVLRREPGPLAIDADEEAALPGGAPLGAGRLRPLAPGAPADSEARQGLRA